jgi:succinate dehydrogenase/fumarate reductase flavoprotein subunit
VAYLFKRGSVYYVKFYVAGKQKEKSLGTGVYQIAKEKQRLFESARARGESLPMPTRTPIAEIVTAYVAAIRTTKTAKSAQTDIYYLRDVFGPICDALGLIKGDTQQYRSTTVTVDGVNGVTLSTPLVTRTCFKTSLTTNSRS